MSYDELEWCAKAGLEAARQTKNKMPAMNRLFFMATPKDSMIEAPPSSCFAKQLLYTGGHEISYPSGHGRQAPSSGKFVVSEAGESYDAHT